MSESMLIAEVHLAIFAGVLNSITLEISNLSTTNSDHRGPATLPETPISPKACRRR